MAAEKKPQGQDLPLADKCLNRVLSTERMVVELKGKLGALAAASSGQVTKPVLQKNGNADRLTAALTNMGYRPAEAARAVELLGDAVANRSLPELLREALALLTR